VVFPGGLLPRARTLQRTRARLFPNSGLAAVIAGFLGAATSFAELAVPFGAVTTDIAVVQPYMITSGPLLQALLASAAIPAIYPLVHHDGRRLYDGGVVANVPMRQASRLAPARSSFSDCTFPGHLPPLDFTYTTRSPAKLIPQARLFLAEARIDGPGLYGSPVG
jgi:NTE family protein